MILQLQLEVVKHRISSKMEESVPKPGHFVHLLHLYCAGSLPAYSSDRFRSNAPLSWGHHTSTHLTKNGQMRRRRFTWFHACSGSEKRRMNELKRSVSFLLRSSLPVTPRMHSCTFLLWRSSSSSHRRAVRQSVGNSRQRIDLS